MHTLDPALQESMCRYYDERAQEYDEIYTLGRGPASISDPSAYTSEVRVLSEIVGELCHGRLVDVPCGTGFWLPHYAQHCSEIALLDQSPGMLAECERRVALLGIKTRCTLIHADVFAYPLRQDGFDGALVGFFLRHLDRASERRLFKILEKALRPGGSFLILDSTWSAERARTRDREGRQTRVLNDGRTFDIYKRYLDQGDVEAMAGAYGLRLSVVHAGRVFIAIHGSLRGEKTG